MSVGLILALTFEAIFFNLITVRKFPISVQADHAHPLEAEYQSVMEKLPHAATTEC